MIINDLINLELTQLSGQTSQPPWNFQKEYYQDVVLINNKVNILKISQKGDFIDFNYSGEASKKEASNKIREILDLDFNLDKFYKFLNNTSELENVAGFSKGLRLFQAKDPFECVISSICSANNSIKRWTKSIDDIKKNYGNKYSNFYTFPNPEEFLAIDDENLKECGVGYRAPYMQRASEIFTLEMNLSEIGKMKYDEAFDTILKVPGVGPKVADCILLYGFNFKEAFPTDVWIKRIISYLYFEGKDIKVSKIRDFGMDEFGKYAGYVQLYLFHYARLSGLMDKIK